MIDELLAARALDGLDEDDAALLERELAAHGDCDECRRLEIEHAEVAGMLALALDPRPVRGDMADRILAEDRTTAAPVERLEARRDARLGWWQAAFGVAAAVAVVFAILLATRDGGGSGIPGSTTVAFEGATPGELAMSFTPGESGALVWATGLPDPGPGNVYEVWMIEDGEPVRGACLAPEGGAVAAFLDADPSSADLLAVTVESEDCPDAPTTDPVYTAELGTAQ
ncbi:MAG: anti-sigma factor domain-containing protein [Actinomycetota bacterium]